MNSAKSSLTKKPNNHIGLGASHVLESMVTGVCAIAAFMSPFLLDGLVMKVAGFVGFFIVGYLITLAIAWLHGER
ncbi:MULTISPECIES: hypothetical protein [Serratia]|uniref:hypothetical protein n=1 Tax=Serratia TaxID=613 RepID=UPI000EFC860E|nr:MULTISPECIES: hypothetical protein [Serratia]MBH2800691.1 hypothetical protein [Serratia ureilytica]MBH2818910.1 hypothetical protein [Serratia ureilytica]MBH2964206.1 hypothetical protein [Serratia ureilytica]